MKYSFYIWMQQELFFGWNSFRARLKMSESCCSLVLGGARTTMFLAIVRALRRSWERVGFRSYYRSIS